jgi:anti-sigma B factor antagonist
MAGTGSRELATDEFRIAEERADGTLVLSIRGDVDLHVAGELSERLESAVDDGPSALVIDLTGVTFLDSTTLAVLLRVMKRLRARGGRFRVVVPRNEIRRIFEVTLLDRVFELDETRREALSATGSANGGSGPGGDRP